jgi:mRNA interferase MazF
VTGYEPDAGDLVWTDFDPRPGREQGGRRPALVLSPVEFWRATGFAFVAPVTSRVRPFPSSVVLPAGGRVTGEVLLGQTRSIDTLARPIRPTGDAVPSDLLGEARAKLAVLLDIA